MEQAGIDGCASQPDQDEPDTERNKPPGEGQDENSRQGQRLPHPNHGAVVETGAQKPACEAPGGDAEVEESDQRCGAVRGQSLDHDHVAAAPQSRYMLQRAVAEEGGQGSPGPREAEQVSQACGGSGVVLVDAGRAIGAVPPEGEREDQERGQSDLNEPHGVVAPRPSQPLGQAEPHDIGAERRPDAPEAVQPVHVPGLVVQSDEIVQHGIHGPGAESVGNGPETDRGERARRGEPEQRGGGRADAESGHPARPQRAHEVVAEQAGYDGAAGDEHGDDARAGHRDRQSLVHAGPRCSQERVRQPQTDEGQVDDGEQQMDHGFPLGVGFSEDRITLFGRRGNRPSEGCQ